MTKPVERSELTQMVRSAIAAGKSRTIPLADKIKTIPASYFFDPAQYELEVSRIFKRVPLLLAATAELPNPGDYKTLEAAGVPVLIVRGQDGQVRAFMNACLHRGANVATEETGNARRFVCPYHGWTYSQEGKLVGVAAPKEFGEVDKSCNSLKTLPCAERAGLIWGVLQPDSGVDIDQFLSGYDALLAGFGFENWKLFSKRTLKGPNWKIAYDGYLDFYHLPVLHRDTFGADMPNQAIYTAWGPHQRVQMPLREYAKLEETPDSQWDMSTLMDGVWTIFPHVSIASFDGGGRGVMLSQLLPGETVDTSYTTQYYLMEKLPEGDKVEQANEQFAFLEHVVRDEDYFTGERLQRALKSGAIPTVMYGRNEAGSQVFHDWVERIIAADDQQLNRLFSGSS